MLKCGGVRKVIRRPNPSEKISYHQFLPCTHCLGFVQKKELWRHTARCPFNEGKAQGNLSGKHSKLQFESEMLLFGSKDGQSNAFIQSIISITRQDEVFCVAKRDDLIFKFGQALFEKDGTSKATYITQKMRSLARLLIDLRKVSNTDDADMSIFIALEHFDSIVQATRTLCSYDPNPEKEPA